MTSVGRVRAAVALLLWLGLLTGILAGLHGLGGVLAPPPMTEPAGLEEWIEGRHPAEAAFALLRLVGLGAAWYLLGATVLSTLVRASRVRVAIRAADVFTVASVRRLTNAVAGVTVAAATVSPIADMVFAGGHSLSPRQIEVITLLAQANTSRPTEEPIVGTETGEGDAGGGSGVPSTPEVDGGGVESRALPTLRRLPDGPETTQPEPRRHPGQPGRPAAPAGAPAPAPLSPPPPVDRWEVKPGQHFWSVAESLLASMWLRPPSDEEVDPYWRRLVAANRSILRDPDNPDLLYPGQVIAVPTPPPAPPGAGSPNQEADPAR